MFKQQRTIQKDATISGIGLHTGDQTTLTFKPGSYGRTCRTDQKFLLILIMWLILIGGPTWSTMACAYTP
jgi:hypothetical protein